MNYLMSVDIALSKPIFVRKSSNLNDKKQTKESKDDAKFDKIDRVIQRKRSEDSLNSIDTGTNTNKNSINIESKKSNNNKNQSSISIKDKKLKSIFIPNEKLNNNYLFDCIYFVRVKVLFNVRIFYF